MGKSNQQVPIIDLAYRPESRSLQTWIVTWMEEEIWCWEAVKANQTILVKTSTNQNPKIHLGCSVNELAVLLKVMSETGIINAKNYKQLISMAFSSFQTSKVREISSKSLSNKYYDPDSMSISSIKGKLIEMINQLNEM